MPTTLIESALQFGIFGGLTIFLVWWVLAAYKSLGKKLDQRTDTLMEMNTEQTKVITECTVVMKQVCKTGEKTQVMLDELKDELITNRTLRSTETTSIRRADIP